MADTLQELKDKLKTNSGRERLEVLLRLFQYPEFRDDDSAPTAEEEIDLLAASYATEEQWAQVRLISCLSLAKKGQIKEARNLATLALSYYEKEKITTHIIDSYLALGVIDFYEGNYEPSIEKYDKAITLCESVGDRSKLAKGLSSKATSYVYIGNYEKALEFSLQSVAIREQTGGPWDLSYAYYNLGTIYQMKGEYPAAIKNYTLSLEIDSQNRFERSSAKKHIALGEANEKQGNYPVALNFYVKGLQLAQKSGDRSTEAIGYNCIGGILDFQGHYEEALKNYGLATQLNEELGHEYGAAAAYYNMALLHHNMKNYAEARPCLDKALKVALKMDYTSFIAMCYNSLGTNFAHQRDFPQALYYYELALKMNEASKEKEGMASNFFHLGMVYQQMNEPEKAEAYFEKSLVTSREGGMKTIEKETLKEMAQLHKKMNRFEESLSYFESYHHLESELLGEQSKKQLTQLNFIHNMEQKEKDLEITHLRNVELKREKDRSESLLLNILPSEVAEELKEKGSADAKLFDEVTVLFTDFKGFTTISEKMTPQELVNELHECFKAFDEIMERHGIEKIKTVGDAYLAAAGLPAPNPTHAEDIVQAALELRDFIVNRKKQLGDRTFEMRVGLHSGKVVAGIVGVKKFAYDIWGDTVNTAARMEQNGEPGKVNISESTYELVKDKFKCEYRGEIEAKNKGKLKMYFVEGASNELNKQ